MGLVYDENNNPLSDVKVTAVLTSADGLSNEGIVDVVTTNKNGEYEIIVPAGEYQLQFEKTQYLGENVYFKSIPEVTTYIDTVTLYGESWLDSKVLTVGHVSNAMNGENVEGATIKFREGWNNTIGNYVNTTLEADKATTNSSGEYSEMLSVGAYTAEISKGRFCNDICEYNCISKGGIFNMQQ